MPTLIQASDVGRRYRHGLAESGPLTWRKLLSRRAPGRDLKPLWAVRHISFDLDAGETLGIVGPNGAGKSTLLRLLGGIGRPDEGELKVDGRVAAMFELGQDFHPDLTGRDNVRTAGVIAGFSRRETEKRLPRVLEFAGLGPFIDSPLRVYSSGMKARLAFAVAIHTDPEILLVDEVLSVGDVGFQRRCSERLRELRTAGVTIVLASHSIDEVMELCDEVMWLRGGRIVAAGPPRLVLDRYVENTSLETRLLTPSIDLDQRTPAGVPLELHRNRFGTLEATIDSVQILDGEGRDCTVLPSGSALRLEVRSSVPSDIGSVNLSIKLIRHRDGLVCMDMSTSASAIAGSVEFAADVERIDLAPGDYELDVGLYTADWDRTLDFHKSAYDLRVSNTCSPEAVLAPPVSWTVREAPPREPGLQIRP